MKYLFQQEIGALKIEDLDLLEIFLIPQVNGHKDMLIYPLIQMNHAVLDLNMKGIHLQNGI